jgi:hypothetical protein
MDYVETALGEHLSRPGVVAQALAAKSISTTAISIGSREPYNPRLFKHPPKSPCLISSDFVTSKSHV